MPPVLLEIIPHVVKGKFWKNRTTSITQEKGKRKDVWECKAVIDKKIPCAETICIVGW